MIIKNLIKKIVAGACLLLTFITYADAPLLIAPTTSNFIQTPNPGHTVIEYMVVNQLKSTRNFALVQVPGVLQNMGRGNQCGNPSLPGNSFTLPPNTYCTLSLTIDRNQLAQIDGSGPRVCPTKGPYFPGTVGCSLPKPEHRLMVLALDPTFPYGVQPQGNVCVATAAFATPETMLGSWAMLQAVNMDVTGSVLPPFLNASNVAYGVGTAAIGDLLGIPGCQFGCDALNGFCFALKFNTKPSYPYMIFQSVNIGTDPNPHVFDIYMAGGGSGAFPNVCEAFWGTPVGGLPNWANNIQNVGGNCGTYFGDYSTIHSLYTVTYANVVHTAKQTLIDACTFASPAHTGFNTQNWPDISIVPVTCPSSLTHITGIARVPEAMVGNQPIHNLSTLTDADFAASTIPHGSTTQMQDCRTPSSGFCGKNTPTLPNYQASISANQTMPILLGPIVPVCANRTGQGFCSWTAGSTAGSDDPTNFCNLSSQNCINNCGNNAPHQWCICGANGRASSCSSNVFG